MKKISPLGIVLILLLLFVPKQKDEDQINTDSSSTVITTKQSAPDNLQTRTVAAGEPAKQPQFAASK